MIYFVGAGPGAPDLLTLRGKELLQKADIIIYAGSLVNRALLQYAAVDCKIYDSAKMHLEEILAVMEGAWEKNKNVVRLHTGDPSLYGAVREQMDALMERNIPYEVCPGVSSLQGAAAALKAEYTLPEVSQTVIITRMAGKTPVPEREKIRFLAEHGATMAVFLSAAMAEDLQKELLLGAYTEETPCAIVYKATWEDEKIIRGCLKELPQLAKRHGIRKTALILVGDFLGDDYALSRLYDKTFTTEFRRGTDS